MEEIKSIIITICMTAAALGLLRLILPDFRYNRQISFLCSCIFAVIIVNSTGGEKFDIREIISNIDTACNVTISADSYRERLNASVLDISESAAEREISEYLSENGFTVQNTEVTAHIDDNLCISISDIKLVFGEAYDSEDLFSANRLLQQKFGRTVSITAKTAPAKEGGEAG